ncbi:hypothetical protein GCK32_015973 [Trichostrongylus colubriformis]|uniref:Tetraspanin n=1 Tax=Trichostrongylus colubriformis TaxID=6319 RepID=A0AAN8IIM3_TRICO
MVNKSSLDSGRVRFMQNLIPYQVISATKFATCVFFYYVLVVMATFALFVLFYSETAEGFTAHSILVYAIRNYHLNRNLAEIVDSLQESLKCCGVASTAQGYRDWNLSYQFNCSASNPQPEKCSVPYSCCRKSVVSEARH